MDSWCLREWLGIWSFLVQYKTLSGLGLSLAFDWNACPQIDFKNAAGQQRQATFHTACLKRSPVPFPGLPASLKGKDSQKGPLVLRWPKQVPRFLVLEVMACPRAQGLGRYDSVIIP